MVPDKVRPRLSEKRDEVDVFVIPHDVSVLLISLIPWPEVSSVCRNMVVHNVQQLPTLQDLIPPRGLEISAATHLYMRYVMVSYLPVYVEYGGWVNHRCAVRA